MEHNWDLYKNKIIQGMNQGKIEPNIQSAADYLGIPRTTLRDAMKREWKWEIKTLEEMYTNYLKTLAPPDKVNYPRVLLKAAVFDIEVTNFEASSVADILACCSILPLDGETSTIAITFEEASGEILDKRVLQETLNALVEYDILIGHNIAGFDFNWLHTRVILFNMNMPKRWLYYDTYFAAKRFALRTRKSLGNLGAFFDLDGVKTAIQRPEHLNVLSKDRQKFNRTLYGTEEKNFENGIIYHCEQDVKINRDAFDILWPRDRQLVNLPFTRKW